MDLLLEATARAEHEHFWFRGFRQFVSPELAAAARGRTGLQLLDCGCGTGANLALLAPYGTAWGFDLTWTGLQTGRRRGLQRLTQASVGQVPFRSEIFDIVTSFDVFVCLDDDVERAAVAEMWRVLKPGGSLVLNVAAMPILRGNHSILSGERRRYRHTSLTKLLEGGGFRIESIRYTNAVLFPMMLAVRLGQRLVGFAEEEHATGEIGVPPKPVNAALSGLLAVEAAIQRVIAMPIGSSLLCRATKPASHGVS